ncbi:MAG: MBL fold metallo-hydrolase [Myxococcales bacterium]
MTTLATRQPLRGFGVERIGKAMRLRDSPLLLDAPFPTEVSFVSHAHSDHIARHGQIIATAPTLRLLEHRLKTQTTALPVPYGKSFRLGVFSLKLLPAGHILGSAQLLATRDDGKRILYTGDFNPVPALATEAAESARCDVLIIESTFGHPRFRFPPREETYARMCAFARSALAEGGTPVFFAYTLGKSQEAMRALADAGLPLVAHPSIADVCEIYASFGHSIPHRRFAGSVEEGEVLFLPAGPTSAHQAIPKARTAMLSGWALESGARYRFGTDEAFPLSDHADFDGLLGYVEATGAKRVLTVHGYAKELAAVLRDRGVDARPFDLPRQMELF